MLTILAGADIKEMKDKTFADAYGKNFIENWSNLTRIKKPIIAAVNGFAVSLSRIFFRLTPSNMKIIVARRWMRIGHDV